VAWTLKGTALVACNCDYGCPCNYNALPTTGACEGGWTWVIEKGQRNGVRLDGLACSIFAAWPGAIHEGGGKAVAFFDDRADEEQRDHLRTLLCGDDGGPWSIFINTYSLEEPRPAPYTVTLAEHHSTLSIEGVVELAMEPIHNPVTGVEVHPGTVLPEGLVFKEGYYATSSVFTVSGAAVAYDHSRRNTEYAPFSYSSE
jgi:hypothetical protein